MNRAFFSLLILLVAGCGSQNRLAPPARVQNPEHALRALLTQHFPARSSLERETLNQRLLSFGEAGLVALCRILGAPENELHTKAEFALHGLAVFVSRPPAGRSARQTFTRALSVAIGDSLSVPDRAFLMSLLELAGDDTAVPVLQRYVHDPRLFDPAIRALTAIGTPACENALVRAFAQADRAQRIALLHALARFRQRSDVPVSSSGSQAILRSAAASEDALLRAIATNALEKRNREPTPSARRETMPAGELAPALESDTLATRLAAIENLMRTRDPAAIAPLLARLERASEPQEIRALEQALLRLPVHRDFSMLAGSITRTADPAARAAILHLLAERQAEAHCALVLSVAKSDASRRVRLAALRALEHLGTTEMLPELMDRLVAAERSSPLGVEDAVEGAAVRQAIVAIARHHEAVDAAAALALKRYPNSSPVQKRALLPLLAKLGTKEVLPTVVAASQDSDTTLHDIAVRQLAGWPNAVAVAPLLDIAARDPHLVHHLLALRGCARLMSDNARTEQQRLELFDRALPLARRIEEKKRLLAALQQMHTPEALKRAADYLDHPELGAEAALALLQIAEIDQGSGVATATQQMVLALVENKLTPEARAQVEAYFASRFEQNRPPEGFVALFNGVDLSGWKGLVKNPVARAKMAPEALAREQAVADSVMRAHWFVENGMLRFDGTGFNNICTVKEYGDFELLVDWKIGPGGDSGIYLRGSPQVQIWDPSRPEAAAGSGGLYNNQQHRSTPLLRADRPVGEWNTFRILMIGERVTVYLNDSLVVDNEVLENDWERGRPIYPAGQIELQAHNTPLWFRNIFIREISQQQPPFAGELFNGRDLSGWQIVDGEEGSWKVKDGVLYTTGRGGGWLSTTREFDDFKLELEFRVSPGGNSGVFLRAPHQGDPAYTGMEIQVLDDYAERYAKLRPWQYTGSIYAVQPPAVRVSKQAGEWQKMQIICNGPHVQVTLNGRKIIETNLIDHMHKTRRNPGLKRRRGYIGLQNHGSLVAYRNIRLEELRD